MSMPNKYAKKFLGFTPDVEKVTRQRKRAKLRAAAISEMHAKYGGEPRRIRRAMGIALGNRRYRESWVA